MRIILSNERMTDDTMRSGEITDHDLSIFQMPRLYENTMSGIRQSNKNHKIKSGDVIND